LAILTDERLFRDALTAYGVDFVCAAAIDEHAQLQSAKAAVESDLESYRRMYAADRLEILNGVAIWGCVIVTLVAIWFVCWACGRHNDHVRNMEIASCSEGHTIACLQGIVQEEGEGWGAPDTVFIKVLEDSYQTATGKALALPSALTTHN
jgi:hypothetical protein